MFAMPLIVDRKLGGLEAFSRSWRTSKRTIVSATVFYLVMELVMLSGVPFCGLGLLVTIPMYYLAIAAQYRGSTRARPRGRATLGRAGQPARWSGPEGIPVWAWLIMRAGMLAGIISLLIVAPLIALFLPAINAARDAAKKADERNRQEAATPQLPQQ